MEEEVIEKRSLTQDMFVAFEISEAHPGRDTQMALKFKR